MTASYNVYKAYTGEYAVVFLLDGRINYNERGTSGTGTKLFNSKNEAENAGKRYLMKMKKNGFSIKDSKEDKSVKVYDPVLCMVVEKSKAKDEDTFVQLRFASGRTEGAKLDPSSFREYAEALLKKYNEKQVTISKNGRALATYINRNVRDAISSVDKAIKCLDEEKELVQAAIVVDPRTGKREPYMMYTNSFAKFKRALILYFDSKGIRLEKQKNYWLPKSELMQALKKDFGTIPRTV